MERGLVAASRQDRKATKREQFAVSKRRRLRDCPTGSPAASLSPDGSNRIGYGRRSMDIAGLARRRREYYELWAATRRVALYDLEDDKALRQVVSSPDVLAPELRFRWADVEVCDENGDAVRADYFRKCGGSLVVDRGSIGFVRALEPRRLDVIKIGSKVWVVKEVGEHFVRVMRPHRPCCGLFGTYGWRTAEAEEYKFVSALEDSDSGPSWRGKLRTQDEQTYDVGPWLGADKGRIELRVDPKAPDHVKKQWHLAWLPHAESWPVKHSHYAVDARVVVSSLARQDDGETPALPLQLKLRRAVWAGLAVGTRVALCSPRRAMDRCGTVVSELERSMLRVRIDNSNEIVRVPPTPQYLTPATRTAYRPGRYIEVVHDGALKHAKVVLSPSSHAMGSRHGLLSGTDEFAVDLNDTNHVALAGWISQRDPKWVEQARDKYCALILETQSTTEDAVTGLEVSVRQHFLGVRVSGGDKNEHARQMKSVHNVVDLADVLTSRARLNETRDHGVPSSSLGVLIRSNAGTGKTWSLQQLHCELAERVTRGGVQVESAQTPLFVPVQELARHLRARQELNGLVTTNAAIKVHFDRVDSNLSADTPTSNVQVPISSTGWTTLGSTENTTSGSQRAVFAPEGDLILDYIHSKFAGDEGDGAEGNDIHDMLVVLYELRLLVILVDGIDEASAMKDELEDFIVNDLMPTGTRVVVTSRPDGLSPELYDSRGFFFASLLPLTDEHPIVGDQLPNCAFVEHLTKVCDVRHDHDRLYLRCFDTPAQRAAVEQFDLAPDRAPSTPFEHDVTCLSPQPHHAFDDIAGMLDMTAHSLAAAACRVEPVMLRDQVVVTVTRLASGRLECRLVCDTADHTLAVLRKLREGFESSINNVAARLDLVACRNLFRHLDSNHFRRVLLDAHFLFATDAGALVHLQVHCARVVGFHHSSGIEAHDAGLRAAVPVHIADDFDQSLEHCIRTFEDIRQTPVFLAMLVVAVRGGRDRHPPSSLFSLYEGAMAAIVRSSDDDDENVRLVLRLLRRIATANHVDRRREFSASDVERCLKGSGRERAVWSDMLAEGSIPLVRIISESGANFEFKHLSFQEALFAQAIVNDEVPSTFWDRDIVDLLADPFFNNTFAVGGNPLWSALARRYPSDVLEDGARCKLAGRRLLDPESALTLAVKLRSHAKLQDLDVRHDAFGDQGLAKMSRELLAYNRACFGLRSLDVSDNNVTSRGITQLATALATNGTLTSLRLADNKVGRKGARDLAAALRSSNWTLALLDLRGNGINDEAARSLAAVLRHNTTLTTLELARNSVGGSGAQALGEALRNNEHLRVLDLASNNLDRGGALAVASMMDANASLRELDLADNHLADDGVLPIAQGLKRNVGLTSINLSSNKITSNGGVKVASMLKANRSLRVVDLSRNLLGSNAVSSIAAAIQRNDVLESLNLDHNRIGNSGASALFSCLETNNAMQVLRLGHNKIGVLGSAGITNLLNSNHGLRVLDLSDAKVSDKDIVRLVRLGNLTVLNLKHNRVGNEGLLRLAMLVDSNPTLTSLDLSHNQIFSSGAAKLAAGLESNSALTHVDLEGNQIGDDGAAQLAKMLETNTTLTRLLLGQNVIGNVGAAKLHAVLAHKPHVRLHLGANNRIRDAKLRAKLQEHEC